MNYKLLLKEARIKNKLSQQQLADILNTTQQAISMYECGVIAPSLERLVDFARTLDVTLDELVEFKVIQAKLSEELLK